jgi:hypothetical protein
MALDVDAANAGTHEHPAARLVLEQAVLLPLPAPKVEPVPAAPSIPVRRRGCPRRKFGRQANRLRQNSRSLQLSKTRLRLTSYGPI